MKLFDKAFYKDQKFKGVFLESEIIANIEFEKCLFESCHFISCEFGSCKFIDCKFDKSDLSASKITESLCLGIKFENSKLLGIDFTTSSSVTSLKPKFDFYKSKLNMSVFTGLDLFETNFIECEIWDVDFAECNLEESNFEKSDLKGTVFLKTNLKHSNFVGAKNYFIDPTQNNIRHAKFSLPEAAILLKPFEVVIFDENGEKLVY